MVMAQRDCWAITMVSANHIVTSHVDGRRRVVERMPSDTDRTREVGRAGESATSSGIGP
jgi:hypothetical protein